MSHMPDSANVDSCLPRDDLRGQWSQGRYVNVNVLHGQVRLAFYMLQLSLDKLISLKLFLLNVFAIFHFWYLIIKVKNHYLL